MVAKLNGYLYVFWFCKKVQSYFKMQKVLSCFKDPDYTNLLNFLDGVSCN